MMQVSCLQVYIDDMMTCCDLNPRWGHHSLTKCCHQAGKATPQHTAVTVVMPVVACMCSVGAPPAQRETSPKMHRQQGPGQEGKDSPFQMMQIPCLLCRSSTNTRQTYLQIPNRFPAMQSLIQSTQHRPQQHIMPQLVKRSQQPRQLMPMLLAQPGRWLHDMCHERDPDNSCHALLTTLSLFLAGPEESTSST